MNITVHPYDDGLVHESLAGDAEFIGKLLALTRTDPDRLNLFQRLTLKWAGRLTAVRPTSPELIRALTLSGQAGAATLALASHPGDRLELLLGDGQPVVFTGAGPNDTTHVTKWLDSFRLATLCRDSDAIRRVCDTPTEVLRASSSRGDEYAYHHVDALRAFWRNDPRLGDHLFAAIEATDPARLHNAAPDYVIDIAVSEMEILFNVIQRDAAGLNKMLAKALICHRSYWSTEERRSDPEGFFALGPLAMAALAYDLGMPIEVNSGYLPARIVHDDWLYQPKA